MNDPARLRDEGATEFEQLLLRSASEEVPDAVLSGKMLTGLSAAGVLGLALSASEQGAAAGAIAWKWLAAAALVGALSAGSYAFLQDKPADSVTTPRPTSAPLIDTTGPVQPANLPPSATPETLRKPTKAVAKSLTLPPASLTSKPTTADLAQELALLDQVRSLLSAKQATSASRLLQKYRSQFPQGRLSQEATVLYVQALKAQGKSEKAETLSREFVKQNPESTHRKQLETATPSAQ